MSASFVETHYGWARLSDDDSWGIYTEIESPTLVTHSLIRGDFEYGGVVFFQFGNGKYTAKTDGNFITVTLREKNKAEEIIH